MLLDGDSAKILGIPRVTGAFRLAFFLVLITTLVACGSSSSSSVGGGGGISVPDVPGNVLAIAGDQRVTVTWDSVAGADTYNVYRSTVSGTGTGGTMVNVGNSPFYHDGVTNGTPYYYVVTAVTSGVQSDASVEATTTPVDILISSLIFADVNLQTCAVNTGATFVHDLVSLSCAVKNIADITGIEALTSMTSLNLFANNNIVDIGALAGLTRLTDLELSWNNITDISVLNNLAGLTYLSLSYNNLAVADINLLLPSLINLTGLALSGLSLSDADLNVLGPNLIGLLSLNISHNNMVVVSPLASVTTLTQLQLSYNSVVDVSSLASLSSLMTLNLRNNGIVNLTPLASLTGITKLNLVYNNIIDVSPLASLTSLNYVYLDNNNIGGQGVGNVDTLTALTGAINLGLVSNSGISCAELGTLIGTLGSPPVDIDSNYSNSDTAIDGVNCANP